MLRSRKFWKVGVGYFTYNSATLVRRPLGCGLVRRPLGCRWYPTLRERGKGHSMVGASSRSKGGVLNHSQST